MLDTDIKANRGNASIVISQIHALNQYYGRDATIILSSRSFEVWLCMYGRQLYTKPYTSQSELNSDVIASYEKKEQWYIDNATRLYDEYPSAIQASRVSKQQVYATTPDPPPDGVDLIDSIPDFSNQAITNYLVKTTPFTYIEHLINVLTQYE